MKEKHFDLYLSSLSVGKVLSLQSPHYTLSHEWGQAEVNAFSSSLLPPISGINAPMGAARGLGQSWSSHPNFQVQHRDSPMEVLPGLTLSLSCFAGCSPREEIPRVGPYWDRVDLCWYSEHCWHPTHNPSIPLWMLCAYSLASVGFAANNGHLWPSEGYPWSTRVITPIKSC